MPNKPAAAKSLRQSKQRLLRHRTIEKELRFALKRAKRQSEVTSATAQQLLRQTVRLVDKAVRQNVLKKNTAARTKSRLMKLWNKRVKQSTSAPDKR